MCCVSGRIRLRPLTARPQRQPHRPQRRPHQVGAGHDIRNERPRGRLRGGAPRWQVATLTSSAPTYIRWPTPAAVASRHSTDPRFAQPWQRGRLQRPAAVLRQPLLSCFSVVAHRAGARVREAALPHRLSAAHTLAWPSRVFSFSLKHTSATTSHVRTHGTPMRKGSPRDTVLSRAVITRARDVTVTSARVRHIRPKRVKRGLPRAPQHQQPLPHTGACTRGTPAASYGTTTA
jgi:hypothetical protein